MATSELLPLQRMASLATEAGELHDIKSLAVVKYMTLLPGKHENEPSPRSRIDMSLIRRASKIPSRRAENKSDPRDPPEPWLYKYGFRPGQVRPVIVELMPY